MPFSSTAVGKTTDHEEPQKYFGQCLWFLPPLIYILPLCDHSPESERLKLVHLQSEVCHRKVLVGLVIGEGFNLIAFSPPLASGCFHSPSRAHLQSSPVAFLSVSVELHLPARWLQPSQGQAWHSSIGGSAAAMFFSSSPPHERDPPTKPERADPFHSLRVADPREFFPLPRALPTPCFEQSYPLTNPPPPLNKH